MPENNHEFQLLGILLQYPDQIDQAADELENRHFSNPQAGLIYEELLKQFRRDGGISRTKLLLKLREGNLVNDPEEIMERLTSGYNSREELKPTIDLIKEDYQKKLLRQAANQLQELAGDPDRTIDQYQSRAQEIVFNATSEASDLEKHIFLDGRGFDKIL